jgi:DNA ligase (NAD+)
VRQEGEANHYCPNEDGCPPQIIGKIEHFVARKAMDIDSIGSEAIELLNKYQLVHNVADLYTLSEASFAEIREKEGWKTDRIGFVSNILNGIEASKSVPFERVLFGLGIRYVGETVAKKLAAAFGSMQALSHANKEALVAVDEIGERIADSIINWFEKPEHQVLVAALSQAGLQLEKQGGNTKISDRLAGLTFVISGVFIKLSRDGAKDLIEAHGGKTSGSVSGKTDYFLAGEGMGPAKLQKAEALGVKILTEDAFLDMIGDETGASNTPPAQPSLF